MSRELDEIKAAAGPYAKYALQARRRFLRALEKSDRQIAKIYNDALRRILEEFKQQGSQTTKALIAAINSDFEQQNLFHDLTIQIEDAISTGAASGITFTQDISLDVLRKAGMSTEPMIRAFEFCRQRAVAAASARTQKDGLFLSDRILTASEKSRDAMRAIVTAGVGEDAVTVARALETYVNKGAAVTAAHFPNMMKRMGSRVPLNLDYNALRLARTELTAAYGEATITACKASPAVKKVRWVLSNTHPRADICDAYANGGDGHGVYDAKDCPLSPAHPNCLCTIQPQPEDPVELVKRLKGWMNDPQSQPDIESWYAKNYKRFSTSKGADIFSRQGRQVLTPPAKKEKKTLENLRERYKILPTMTAEERERTIKGAGGEFYSAIKKEAVFAERDRAVKELYKAQQEAEKAYDEFWKSKNPYRTENYGEYRQIVNRLKDLNRKYNAAYFSRFEDNAKTFAAQLAKIREVGADEAQLKGHLAMRGRAAPDVAKAYRHYPREWVEMSFARGKIKTKNMDDRGYYSDWDSTIAISGNAGGKRLSCAIHELGHRMEHTIPDIMQAEKAFYERRTKGYGLEWLGGTYKKSEKGRRDKFIDPYIGKDYGGFGYELVSMGFQWAYTDPLKLMQDKDMAEWIFGILAIL